MTFVPVDETGRMIEYERLGATDAPVSITERAPCQHPECSTPNGQAHHLFPRSHTGGPRDMITIDGVHVPNLMVFCWFHHDLLTRNLAYMQWDGIRFHWRDGRPAHAMAKSGSLGEGGAVAESPGDSGADSPSAKVCNRCGGTGKLPERAKAAEPPKRKWMQVNIRVPVDAGEDGGQLLHEQIEQTKRKTGREDEPAYYAVFEGLTSFNSCAFCGLDLTEPETVIQLVDWIVDSLVELGQDEYLRRLVAKVGESRGIAGARGS